MFPQLFGKYVLEREIAAGGMARVYLATLRGAVGFEKRLVVKQIRPELAVDQAFVRRFVEEAKTAVELSHPNIVPVYELGVEQGVYYIAMELCAGVTLSEMLAENGKLTPEEGAYVGVEICRALDYAHRRAGIVHRDVTPRNVLIDEEGAVRLIDFGIAAPAMGNDRGPSEVFGSPGHMPPEQMAGKPLSPSADVFAVAVLLYEAWSGRPAFRRATSKESFDALKQTPPAIHDTEPELAPLSDLLQRGLSRDPDARPAQAELFARPLRDFLRNVDAGDVARRLGARVRRTLQHARRSAGWGVAPAPGTPASSERGAGGAEADSHTFAAREEISEWTRQIHPPPSSAKDKQRTSFTPAALVTPSANESHSTRKLPSMPPDAHSKSDDEGPNTPSAPLAPTSTTGRVAEPAKGSRAIMVSLVLVLLIGASSSLFSRSRRTEDAPPRPAHSQVSLEPAKPLAREVQVEAARASSPVSRSRPEASGVARLSTAAAPSAATAAAPPKSNPNPSPGSLAGSSVAASISGSRSSGRLRLTADLPATVSVQGASGVRSFSTPVRALSLPAGAYTIVFRSSTYGSPVVTQVTLEPNAERGVHVDFREAEPRVSLR